MRDLYKRLGVPTSSAEAEIRSALTRTPHAGLRKDIEAVLLDPARRWVYDRIHAVIADTGRLRARLGLNHPPNWQGIAASDFSVIDDCSFPQRKLGLLGFFWIPLGA